MDSRMFSRVGGTVIKSSVLSTAVLIGGAVMNAVAMAAPATDSHPAADLIVHNARVWTVNPKQPQAEAVAVLNGRIVAVGAEAAVMPWRGPNTRVVDAKGGRIVPGFNDAHVHFSDGGAGLNAVQLTQVASLKEFVHRVAEYASHAPKGEWIRNGYWDETKWSPARLPTREDIDAVTPDNPVALDRYDGHMTLVNSKVLALAGITSKTPDPPGGMIVRDATGQPTGALKDAAAELIAKVAPPLTPAQRRRAIERSLQEAAMRGVTSIQDMSLDYGDLAVYSRLR